MRWVPAGGGDAWAGQAVVCGLPVGGSVVQVRLDLPDARPARLSEADRVVSEVLRRLDAASVRAVIEARPTDLQEARPAA